MPSHRADPVRKFRPQRRHALVAGAFVGITSAVVAVVTSSASGTPKQPSPVSAAVAQATHDLAATLNIAGDRQRNAVTYWTQQRMAAAHPAGGLLNGVLTHLTKASPPASTHTQRRAASDPAGAVWTSGGLVAKTTGKVFFTLGGQDLMCSGSVVASENKSVVVTAGHCANEGPGSFATNVVFVPGYSNGEEPYGEWSARQLVVPSTWQTKGDPNEDVAFITLAPRNGQTLDNVVGAERIAFNQARGQNMYAFGYPASDQQGLLHYCHGRASDDTIGGTRDVRITCDMTEGSSGGPGFINFNPNTGTGTVMAVNALGYDNDSGGLYLTYLDDPAQQAFLAASKN